MIGPLEILQTICGLFILFFMPGYTFTIALFPRKGELDKEYDGLYKISLGIGMSIVLVVLTGFGLNSLGVYKTASGDYMGYVQTPYLLAAFFSESAIFFLIGWYRGGFPFMSRLHPKLARASRAEPGMIEVPADREKYLGGLEKYGRRREKVKKDIKDFERKKNLSTGSLKGHYQKKIDDAQKELKVINDEISRLEQKISEELY